MDSECCGTCRCHCTKEIATRYDIQHQERVCDNPESEEYGLETEYGYWCKEYEELG